MVTQNTFTESNFYLYSIYTIKGYFDSIFRPSGQPSTASAPYLQVLLVRTLGYSEEDSFQNGIRVWLPGSSRTDAYASTYGLCHQSPKQKSHYTQHECKWED